MICLCFLATGAQWDLVQGFAWGRMMAGHSRTMSLSSAVAKTFDGEMCPICRMVAKARQKEQSQSNVPETKLAGKVLLFFQAVPEAVVEAPCAVACFSCDATAMTKDRSAPPVPPPKIVVG
jgi:hypothetical protein